MAVQILFYVYVCMYNLQLHSKKLEGVVSRSFWAISFGPTHDAIPDSTKSFFIQSDNHFNSQSQYNGFPPRALLK